MMQPKRRSAEFAARMERLYEDHGLPNDQAASDFMDGAISRVHLRDLRLGKIPGPEAFRSLLSAFPKDAPELIDAAGYGDIFRAADRSAAEPLAAYLEPEEVDFLESEARRRGTSTGGVLREAVREYRVKREGPISD